MVVKLTVYCNAEGKVRIADHPPGNLSGWEILYTFEHQVILPEP